SLVFFSTRPCCRVFSWPSELGGARCWMFFPAPTSIEVLLPDRLASGRWVGLWCPPVRPPEGKILDRTALAALGKKLRSEGLRIISTNGCFDLLHWGHIDYLTRARKLGDRLVCGGNSDLSVRSLDK